MPQLISLNNLPTPKLEVGHLVRYELEDSQYWFEILEIKDGFVICKVNDIDTILIDEKYMFLKSTQVYGHIYGSTI